MSKKRVFIFASYDKDNIIDEYVVYYIKKLSEIGDVIFVSDNNLNEDKKNKIKNLTIKIIAKNHGEYDFGSYKIGINYLKNNNLLNNYNWITICNDSVYGPFYELEPILKKMEEKNPDVWSFTMNTSNNSPHLQSYFISFSKRVINNKKILNFFYNIKKENSKSDIVKKYEIGLSKLLYKNNYKLIGYLKEIKKFPYLPTETYYLININKEFPFMKKKLITENKYSIPKLYKFKKILKCNSEYPIDLIENNAIRLIGIKKYNENINCLNFIFILKALIFLLKRLPSRLIKLFKK